MIILTKHCRVVALTPSLILAEAWAPGKPKETQEICFPLAAVPFHQSSDVELRNEFVWEIHSEGNGVQLTHHFDFDHLLPKYDDERHLAPTAAPPGRKSQGDRTGTWEGTAFPDLTITAVRTAEGVTQIYLPHATKVLMLDEPEAESLSTWLKT